MAITKALGIPLPQQLFFALMLALAIANGWSAFALWHCRDFDVEPAPLIIHIVMIFFLYGFPFSVMVSRLPFVDLCVAIVSLAMSATYTALGWKHNGLVGGVGLVDIFISMSFFFFAIVAWVKLLDIHAEHSNIHFAEHQKDDSYQPFAPQAKIDDGFSQDPTLPRSLTSGSVTSPYLT